MGGIKFKTLFLIIFMINFVRSDIRETALKNTCLRQLETKKLDLKNCNQQRQNAKKIGDSHFNLYKKVKSEFNLFKQTSVLPEVYNKCLEDNKVSKEKLTDCRQNSVHQSVFLEIQTDLQDKVDICESKGESDKDLIAEMSKRLDDYKCECEKDDLDRCRKDYDDLKKEAKVKREDCDRKLKTCIKRETNRKIKNKVDKRDKFSNSTADTDIGTREIQILNDENNESNATENEAELDKNGGLDGDASLNEVSDISNNFDVDCGLFKSDREELEPIRPAMPNVMDSIISCPGLAISFVAYGVITVVLITTLFAITLWKWIRSSENSNALEDYLDYDEEFGSQYTPLARVIAVRRSKRNNAGRRAFFRNGLMKRSRVDCGISKRRSRFYKEKVTKIDDSSASVGPSRDANNEVIYEDLPLNEVISEDPRSEKN